MQKKGTQVVHVASICVCWDWEKWIRKEQREKRERERERERERIKKRDEERNREEGFLVAYILLCLGFTLARSHILMVSNGGFSQ